MTHYENQPSQPPETDEEDEEDDENGDDPLADGEAGELVSGEDAVLE